MNECANIQCKKSCVSAFWYVSHTFLLLTTHFTYIHVVYRVQAYIDNYVIHWLKGNDFNETVPTSFFKISLWVIMALSGINFTHMNHWCNQNGNEWICVSKIWSKFILNVITQRQYYSSVVMPCMSLHFSVLQCTVPSIRC